MSLQRTVWSGLLAALALFLGTASRAQEKVTSPSGLEWAWSLEWVRTGLATDERSGAIYAIGPVSRIIEVDLGGKQKRETTLPMGGLGFTLRLATFRGDAGKALLTWGASMNDLKAYDLSGKQLWSYRGGIGVEDVWAGDLDGDGSDEVIVGYGELHVLNSNGQLLWKSAVLGPIWHVCAGDVLGEGKSQVVTTSGAGRVLVFGSDGKSLKYLDAGFYASMVRIGKLSGQDKAATILVAGTSLGGRADQKLGLLAALSGDGTKRWSLELPDATRPIVTRVISAYVAPGKPWLAVGMSGGQVHVIDIEAGQIIASVHDQGGIPEVGWVKNNNADGPLLLVATGHTLNAFRVMKR